MCRILTQALIQATIRNTNLQLLRSVCLPSIHERPKNRNDRGTTIEWSNQPPNTRGRQTSSNVTTGRIGMRGQAKTAKKPWEAWELFFTDEMLSLIVANTNKKKLRKSGNILARSFSTTAATHTLGNQARKK